MAPRAPKQRGRPKGSQNKGPTKKMKRMSTKEVEVLDSEEEIDASSAQDQATSAQDQASSASAIEENETTELTEAIQPSEIPETSPPGVPIPFFTKARWPSWREKFFTDWRHQAETVWAKCKVCENGHFHSGSFESFSNFLKHIDRIHAKEYKDFESGHQKPITDYTVETKICTSRQSQLNDALAAMFIDGCLPFNTLTRPSFRNWVKVSVETLLILRFYYDSLVYFYIVVYSRICNPISSEDERPVDCQRL